MAVKSMLESSKTFYQPGDDGPFWMSAVARNECRHDVTSDEAAQVDRYKADLALELQSKGISTKGKNKTELIALCNSSGIPITRSVQKTKEGWDGTERQKERVHQRK